VSYRPLMTGRAAAQFSDIMGDEVVYDAFMKKVLRLIDAPWDAWPVYPDGPARCTPADQTDRPQIPLRRRRDRPLRATLSLIASASWHPRSGSRRVLPSPRMTTGSP